MATFDSLPFGTKEAWDLLKENNDLHPGLTFYRFMEIDDKEGTYAKDCLARFPARSSIPHAPALVLRFNEQKRWMEDCEGWKVKVFRGRLLSRMAVGMGISSISENGIYLDHTLGVPLIPGSVLKGVAQDFALIENDALYDADQNEKFKRENTLFTAIFGAQTPKRMDEHFLARQGQVIFFDAFPVDAASPFEIDIMNPHYGDYYSNKGDVPPADYLNPTPIFFPTVKAGTVFQFALAAQAKPFTPILDNGSQGEPFELDSSRLLETAFGYLKKAISDLGVGGKTRVGYGLFKVEGDQ